MSGKNALILGATGSVGKHLLQELLASPQYASVHEYGRRVTSSDRITIGKEKLQQKTFDFEKLEESGLNDKKWDVVFISIGTTKKKAGSLAAFEKIDREYVINAARAAKSKDPSHPQRLVYCSSQGSNPNSMFPYMKSKALTELGLAELGYKETIIMKPAALGEGQREDSRPLEELVHPIIKAFSVFSDSLYMPVPKLAKAMRIVGERPLSELPPNTLQKGGDEKISFDYINNSSILALASAFE